MTPNLARLQHQTRRHFLPPARSASGPLALAVLSQDGRAEPDRSPDDPLAPRSRTSPAKAKRVIYLHMSGSPPHLDLFDYKPELVKRNGQDCPESFLKGKRFAFTTGMPKLLGTPQTFTQHGKGGVWMSDALPHLHERRRRAVRHQVDEHRPVQPRPGRAAALHRLAAAGPAVDGLVGHLRPGHRERRTCPASSC